MHTVNKTQTIDFPSLLSKKKTQKQLIIQAKQSNYTSKSTKKKKTITEIPQKCQSNQQKNGKK